MGWMERIRLGGEERVLAGLTRAARRREGKDALPAFLATGIDGETAAFLLPAPRGLHRGGAALELGRRAWRH